MKKGYTRSQKLITRAGLMLALVMACQTMLSAQAESQPSSTQPQALSLKQAVEYAMKNQVSVQNADINTQVAQQQVAEIRGIGLPQVSGSIDFNYYIKRPTQLLPGEFFGAPAGTYIPIQFGTKYNATIGASASQLVFDGAYLVGLKAAATYVDLSRKSLKAEKIEVATNVTKAYYGVLVMQKRVGIIDANLERLEKSYRDVKAMYDNGFVEKLDVDRLEVALNNLRIEKQKLENGIELSKNLLKFQMSLPVTATVELTDSLVESNLPEPVEVKPDPKKRIEYNMLQTAQALSELDLKRYKSAYLPSLAAFGSYSWQAQRNEFNFFSGDEKWYPIGLVGAKLNVPIFDGLQRESRIQKAKLSLQQSSNNLLNMERVVAMQTQAAVLTYENNYSTLKNQRKNMELAQEIVRVTQAKYTQGVGSNLEVVNAEAALKEAQTIYFGALYDLLISQVDLQKATGSLY